MSECDIVVCSDVLRCGHHHHQYPVITVHEVRVVWVIAAIMAH